MPASESLVIADAVVEEDLLQPPCTLPLPCRLPMQLKQVGQILCWHTHHVLVK